MGYIYIGMTIVFTVYGQLILKHQVNSLTRMPSGVELIPFYFKFIVTRPLVLSGFLSAILASISWLGAISKFDLSTAYPFMALNFVIVLSLSRLFFGENLDLYKIIGSILICLGLVVASKGM